MRIETLKQLIEVAETQSITIAASRLFITQPSLSQSISAMEKELEIKIFNRSKNGTQLTELGKQVLTSAKKIVEEEEKLISKIKYSNSQPTGSISIATIPSFAMAFLPKTIAKFKSQFPGIKIKVNEGGSHFVREQVLMGKADIGLLSKSESHYTGKEKMIFKFLIKSNIKVLVNKESSLSIKPNLHPEELIKHDIVIFNNNYNINAYIYNLLKPYGEPSFFFTTNNPDVMKKVIMDGLAIGFYANLALVSDPLVKSGDIIPLEIADQNNTQRDYGLVIKSNIEETPYIQSFIHELYFHCELFKKIHNYKEIWMK